MLPNGMFVTPIWAFIPMEMKMLMTWYEMDHGCMQLLQDASYHLVLVFVGAKRTEYIPFTLLVCHSLWSSVSARSRNRVGSILSFPKRVLWKCIQESREETCILNDENNKWKKHQVQIATRLIPVEEITLYICLQNLYHIRWQTVIMYRITFSKQYMYLREHIYTYMVVVAVVVKCTHYSLITAGSCTRLH